VNPGLVQAAELGRARSFAEGVKAVLPIMLGVVPFGVICGAVCVESGMTEWGAIGLSVFVFAGASQIVVAQMMSEQGVVGITILTALAINLRMMMYSASIAPHLGLARTSLRALCAYLLTDQAFATSINRFSEEKGEAVNRAMFYLGAGSAMWVSFNLTNAFGAFLGPMVPAGLGLDFAIPLTFIALVIPRISDKPSLCAALASGVMAFAFNGLPLNLGVLAAASSGILCGCLFSRLELEVER